MPAVAAMPLLDAAAHHKPGHSQTATPTTKMTASPSASATQGATPTMTYIPGSGGLVWNPMEAAYGAVGDGTTNDTTAVQAAINAASTGGAGATVWIPGGKIFNVTQLSLPSGSNLIFTGGGTILHRAASTGTMIVCGGALAGLTMRDIKLDGNSPNVTSWTVGALTLNLTNGALLENVTVTRTRKQGVLITAAGRAVRFQACKFVDLAEHGANLNEDAGAITANGSNYLFSVTQCDFWQTTITTSTRLPGGIQVSGTNINAYIDGNTFKNIGTQYTGETIGCIYLYTNGDKTTVTNNHFYTPYYTAISCQNSHDTIVTGNQIHADANLVGYPILIAGMERSNNIRKLRSTVSNNIITGASGVTGGIVFQGDVTYELGDFTCSSNVIVGCTVGPGIKCRWTSGGAISNNKIKSCAGGIQIVDASYGDYDLANNRFEDMTDETILGPPTTEHANGVALNITGGGSKDCTSPVISVPDATQVTVNGFQFRGTPTTGNIILIALTAKVIVTSCIADTNSTRSITGTTILKDLNNSWS